MFNILKASIYHNKLSYDICINHVKSTIDQKYLKKITKYNVASVAKIVYNHMLQNLDH